MYKDHAGFQLGAILSPAFAFGMLGLYLGMGQQIKDHRFQHTHLCGAGITIRSPGLLQQAVYTMSHLSPVLWFFVKQCELVQTSLKFPILLISPPEYKPTFDVCSSEDQINPKHYICLISTLLTELLPQPDFFKI